MNGREFSAILASRFQAIVPIGFTVSDRDGLLEYAGDPAITRNRRAGSYASETFDLMAESVPQEERAVLAGQQALDELQDYIDEQLMEPWPGARVPPRAHAEVRGRLLFLCFEADGEPVLECEPIELD